MAGELHEFLSRDHARLDELLAECLRRGNAIDANTYAEFRRGLLRHIAMEEKVLFPEIRKREGETVLVRQLHRDHAALAALLVPPPSPVELGRIAEVLRTHNELEEVSGGLYEIVEHLTGDELTALMSRVRAIPPVAVAPHADTPLVRSTIEQLLREAEEGRARMRPPSP